MKQLGEIVYENPSHWVRRAAKGYEVYRHGATASERCAIFGSDGEYWLKRAVADADRRHNETTPLTKLSSF